MESLGRSFLEARNMAVPWQAGLGSVMSVIDGPGLAERVVEQRGLSWLLSLCPLLDSLSICSAN